MVMLGDKEQEVRIEFLKKYRNRTCPAHGGKIVNGLFIGTFWCPECENVWKVHTLASGKQQWWYEDTLGQLNG